MVANINERSKGPNLERSENRFMIFPPMKSNLTLTSLGVCCDLCKPSCYRARDNGDAEHRSILCATCLAETFACDCLGKMNACLKSRLTNVEGLGFFFRFTDSAFSKFGFCFTKMPDHSSHVSSSYLFFKSLPTRTAALRLTGTLSG